MSEEPQIPAEIAPPATYEAPVFEPVADVEHPPEAQASEAPDADEPEEDEADEEADEDEADDDEEEAA